MGNEMVSVGIDIGTTTMSMIVSRLGITNMAAAHMVPDINISKKEIIYRSPLYLTPLIDQETLDGEKIRQIITEEYEHAQIRPDMIDTGAVIITGESALKKNAEIITQSLSMLAGDFVVATAGPDLESVLAGRGAGAEKFSKKYACMIANLDIGGGTTNISLFDCGELIGQTCIDVGGRLIRYDEQHVIRYVSPRLAALAETRGVTFTVGEHLDEWELEQAAEILADTIFDSISPEHGVLTKIATTYSSEPLELGSPIPFLSFSGGVADCYYRKEQDRYRYLDLGVALAQELARREPEIAAEIVEPEETIRATVVGAGTYTTEVSGSTISYEEDIFPIKSLPVCVLSQKAEDLLFEGESGAALDELTWFKEQSQIDELGIFIRGKQQTGYRELIRMADGLILLGEHVLAGGKPLIVICRNDIAKALGQIMSSRKHGGRTIICLDRIRMRSGDYIDIGSPVMDGMAVPIVVKTLIFN